MAGHAADLMIENFALLNFEFVGGHRSAVCRIDRRKKKMDQGIHCLGPLVIAVKQIGHGGSRFCSGGLGEKFSQILRRQCESRLAEERRLL